MRRSALLCLACLVLIPALLACQGLVPDPDTQTETETKQDEEKYTYLINIEPYLPFIDPEDQSQHLLLVNKEHPLGESYTPKDLAELECRTNGGKTLELNETAAKALYAMLAEMNADGITDVSVTSAYRTYAYQSWLFNYYTEQETASHPDWTQQQVKDYVLTYSAYPGTSEHQSGLCVDLWVDGMTDLVNYGAETSSPQDPGFAETFAYTWLKENAYRFGFILRYPEDKESVTGYSYESWHYRFVGRKAAAQIYQNGLTLEEYLAEPQ